MSRLRFGCPPASALGNPDGGQWTDAGGGGGSSGGEAGEETDLLNLVRDTDNGGNGGGKGSNGCVVALAACTGYSERLYDLGYEKESFELRQSCYSTAIGCNGFDAKVQSLGPPYFGLTTFPPHPAQGGGGVVYHQYGSQPVYVPPAKDPLAHVPRAR